MSWCLKAGCDSHDCTKDKEIESLEKQVEQLKSDVERLKYGGFKKIQCSRCKALGYEWPVIEEGE